MTKLSGLKAAFLVISMLGAWANANERTGVLKKVTDTGTINIGHRDASIPFSYYDESKQPIGYTIDICQKIVERLKKDLGLPNIKINYVKVTASDRIQKVASGEVDMECGSTTNTKERSTHVTFSNTLFVASTRIMVKAGSDIKGIDTLKGKRVVILQGSSNAPLLAKIDAEKQLGIQYVRTKDFAEGFQAFEAGRGDAFVNDDIQFAHYISRSANPKAYEVVGEPLGVDPIAIGLPKDDKPLHDIVNSTLSSLYSSGELTKIYDKWFVSPQLRFPMNDALKNVLKKPDNKAYY